MPTIEEGQSAEFTAPAGQQVTVSTDGRARIYRREGMPNPGQFAAQVVTGEAVFSGLNLATEYRIEAVSGDVNYQISWPLVSGLPFRRNAAGAIDAVMDGDTAVPLGGGDPEPVSWGDVQDKPAVIAAGADQAAARVAIGAGTSNLEIGTTADTAMAGNTPIPAAPTWSSISGKPAVVAEGADQAAARASIGAGTSNLALGTTASTAAAGDHTHPEIADLESRVAALEAAAG